MKNMPTTILVSAGEQHVVLTPGALHYLVRHSFRERVFVFMEPYPDEVEPNWTPSTLISESVAVGWFIPAPAIDIVTHWAKVDDLKIALLASGLSTRGKRAELLERCLAQCPGWVDQFASLTPAYYPTDLGRIELQATRPEPKPYGKEVHLKLMREYFERDRKDARSSKSILGIRIWPREDGYWAGDPCPRAAGFSGVFLPDELPELYPDDCPNEDSCACLNREMVLSCDNSEAATLLREKMEKRGMPPPPPPWGAIKPISEEEQAEMVEIAKKALEVEPEKNRDVWSFILGLFSKK